MFPVQKKVSLAAVSIASLALYGLRAARPISVPGNSCLPGRSFEKASKLVEMRLGVLKT